MGRNEVVLIEGNGGGGDISSKSNDAIVDRSKVRILLCDNDRKSSEEVLMLLRNCSYQVTSVRSARQVIDALNAERPDIDVILSELDLPMDIGLKMLNYILRRKELQRIPVIIMSAQDEGSVVVKCLRLGAADFLIKPLRTNELFNLWAHMWRRRQMLGLAEKNIFNYEFDLRASDHSNGSTNSSTLFLDDTDDKSRKSVNWEMFVSTHQKDESNADVAVAPVMPPLADSLVYCPDMPGISDRQIGQTSSCPKKSELNIGESSTFFKYIKSRLAKSNSQGVTPVDENSPRHLRIQMKLGAWSGQMDSYTQGHEDRETLENHSQDHFPSRNSRLDSPLVLRSSTSPVQQDFSRQRKSKTKELSQVHMHPRNESRNDVSGFHALGAYPYCIPGAMNQALLSTSAQIYQKNVKDLQNHAISVNLPRYNHISQSPLHVPELASLPFYPVNICQQPDRIPSTHPLLSSTAEGEIDKVDRREAALIKFRQKRKKRCFNKKIRYANRKLVAERKHRVHGQFARKSKGINVDLNEQPASVDLDEDDEKEDMAEHAAQNSASRNDSSMCQ